ncbi:MAG: hypothetical protein KDK70_40845, partial [Myxococcales bacterium]|nr:hypothetical protein [Myxococcales bacterium]
MGPAPEPPKRPWRPSRVALLAGTALAALGLAADVIGVSSRPGIGGLQLGVLALGAAVALWGALERRPRAQRGLSRIFLLVGSVYLALWLVELLMAYPLNPRVNFKSHILSLQGMYEVGERVSYRHVAGYTGTFDDGVVMMPIQINHRGDRDDEPRDDHPSRARLMLVGDSFTFGQGLEDAQRIDRRIEHRSGGQVDAYDLGVMGYGSRDSLLRLRESAWWRGRSIYYLFFTNDLELSNTHPDHYTVHDGFVVPRLRADGQAYTPQALTQLLAS